MSRTRTYSSYVEPFPEKVLASMQGRWVNAGDPDETYRVDNTTVERYNHKGTERYTLFWQERTGRIIWGKKGTYYCLPEVGGQTHVKWENADFHKGHRTFEWKRPGNWKYQKIWRANNSSSSCSLRPKSKHIFEDSQPDNSIRLRSAESSRLSQSTRRVTLDRVQRSRSVQRCGFQQRQRREHTAPRSRSRSRANGSRNTWRNMGPAIKQEKVDADAHTDEATCLKGHPLAKLAIKYSGQCDICKDSIVQGAISLHCSICEYDRCAKCIEGRPRRAKSRSRLSDEQRRSSGSGKGCSEGSNGSNKKGITGAAPYHWTDRSDKRSADGSERSRQSGGSGTASAPRPEDLGTRSRRQTPPGNQPRQQTSRGECVSKARDGRPVNSSKGRGKSVARLGKFARSSSLARNGTAEAPVVAGKQEIPMERPSQEMMTRGLSSDDDESSSDCDEEDEESTAVPKQAVPIVTISAEPKPTASRSSSCSSSSSSSSGRSQTGARAPAMQISQGAVRPQAATGVVQCSHADIGLRKRKAPPEGATMADGTKRRCDGAQASAGQSTSEQKSAHTNPAPMQTPAAASTSSKKGVQQESAGSQGAREAAIRAAAAATAFIKTEATKAAAAAPAAKGVSGTAAVNSRSSADPSPLSGPKQTLAAGSCSCPADLSPSCSAEAVIAKAQHSETHAAHKVSRSQALNVDKQDINTTKKGSDAPPHAEEQTKMKAEPSLEPARYDGLAGTATIATEGFVPEADLDRHCALSDETDLLRLICKAKHAMVAKREKKKKEQEQREKAASQDNGSVTEEASKEAVTTAAASSDGTTPCKESTQPHADAVCMAGSSAVSLEGQTEASEGQTDPGAVVQKSENTHKQVAIHGQADPGTPPASQAEAGSGASPVAPTDDVTAEASKAETGSAGSGSWPRSTGTPPVAATAQAATAEPGPSSTHKVSAEGVLKPDVNVAEVPAPQNTAPAQTVKAAEPDAAESSKTPFDSPSSAEASEAEADNDNESVGVDFSPQ